MSRTVRLIRVLEYEGDEDAIRTNLSLSAVHSPVPKGFTQTYTIREVVCQIVSETSVCDARKQS